MFDIPSAADFTTAPLRHRLRLELDAPASEVWALVGSHERLPEYSAGIKRVELSAARDARICHFRPFAEGDAGIELREQIRWVLAGVGYATSAASGNAFGLENDLSLVTVRDSGAGTLYCWEQRYDHPDVQAMSASFQDGLEDIARRLVARFGGRVIEQAALV